MASCQLGSPFSYSSNTTHTCSTVNTHMLTTCEHHLTLSWQGGCRRRVQLARNTLVIEERGRWCAYNLQALQMPMHGWRKWQWHRLVAEGKVLRAGMACVLHSLSTKVQALHAIVPPSYWWSPPDLPFSRAHCTFMCNNAH